MSVALSSSTVRTDKCFFVGPQNGEQSQYASWHFPLREACRATRYVLIVKALYPFKLKLCLAYDEENLFWRPDLKLYV